MCGAQSFHGDRHDEAAEFPWDFYNAFAEAGWLGVLVPEAYGGAGLGVRHAGELLGAVARSAEQGAATQCYVATAPALERVSGAYFADCNPARTSIHARDPALAARLWSFSEELAADYL